MSGPCATATSQATLTPPAEPGQPLQVNGRVFRPDGKTPAAGVIVYAYQTGIDGLYGPRGSGNVRIHGWMKTAADGSFTIKTIRPASYPNSTIPAHIHFQLWNASIAPQYTPDLLFDDDPHLKAKDRSDSARQGNFANIRKVENGAVSINLRLKDRGDRLEDNTLHGLRPCGLSER